MLDFISQWSGGVEIRNIFELKACLLTESMYLVFNDDFVENLAQGFDLSRIESWNGAICVTDSHKEDTLAGEKGAIHDARSTDI